jgi:serine/threonine-protein kinase
MSSEQCAGRPNYSSDIYSLGMVAIKALTGYSPTDLPTDPATGELVWRDKAKVSNGLAMVLTRMVRYHYTQRYQSVREVNQGITTFATMTEVERQATTSKIVRSTILTSTGGSLATTNAAAMSKAERETTRRSIPASAPATSNSGILFLFGGLLAVVAVIAAFAVPSMVRNNQTPIIVNNPPIANVPKPLTPEVNPTPTATVSGESINQPIALEANKESLTIPNKISGSAVHTYIIQAKSGQVLSAAITGNGVLMTVLNPQAIALPNAANVAIADLPITVDGAYTVQLRGIPSAEPLPYQIKLGLKDTATPSVSASPLVSPLASPSPSPLVTPPSGTTPVPPPSPTPTQPAQPKIEIKIRNK